MSNDTSTPVARNRLPTLSWVAGSAVPVAHFTVASTSRVQDNSSGEWCDSDTLFLRCAAWRFLGQNAVESLRKVAAAE